MNAAILLLATTAVGVDIGWQPLETGGFEYIIQIEPQIIDALKRGRDVGGDIPADIARNIRSFRVTLGTGRAPRLGDPAAGPPLVQRQPLPAESASETPLPADARTPEPAVPNGPANEQPPMGEAPARGMPPEDRFPHPPGEGRSPVDSQPSMESPPSLPNNEPVASAPKTFVPEPDSQSIHRAGYGDDAAPRFGVAPPARSNSFVNTNPAAGAKPEAKASPAKQLPVAAATEAPKPWFPFTLALMGLFASVGGNMFLGSLAWSYRNRCLALLGRGTRRQLARRRPVSRYEEEDEDQDVKAVEEE